MTRKTIPLGTPTWSARTRHGTWALHPNGAEILVLWPGGSLVGPPVEVARELERIGEDGTDDLDRDCARTIRRFLTDPAAHDSAPWLAGRSRNWSSPARGYWITGPFNQPGHGEHQLLSWPGAPARLPRPPVALPGRGLPGDAQPDPSPPPVPAPQRAA